MSEPSYFSQLFAFISNPLVASTLVAAILGISIGAFLTWQHAQKLIQSLQIDKARLESDLSLSEKYHEQQLEQMANSREELNREFSDLSKKALRENTGMFLRYANQTLKNQRDRATADLDQKQQAVEHLLQPLKDALKRSEAQIAQLEKERQTAYGAISTQLEQLSRDGSALRGETNNLVQALKRPDVRGRWGEMTLKRLAELAGMIEYCDFQEQVSDSKIRPDMVIRMPDQRELIIDAKTPLDGYLSALDADDEAGRKAAMLQHSKNLRARMRELSNKQYWAQFKHSPDFVVMFIPGDQFLSAALASDPSLLDDALKNHVVLATPSTLIALLRSVAFGWRQMALSDNADKIREVGENLFHRIATLSEHFERLGKSLGQSVEHYNRSLGSLERQLYPSAKKMTELGVEKSKEIASPAPLEQRPRPPFSSDKYDSANNSAQL